MSFSVKVRSIEVESSDERTATIRMVEHWEGNVYDSRTSAQLSDLPEDFREALKKWVTDQ